MDLIRQRFDVDALNKLVNEKFRGNKSWFAEEIGVDTSYVNQVLNKKAIDHSPKMLKGFLKYCKKNNIDAKKYIFLGWIVNKFTKGREIKWKNYLKLRKPHMKERGNYGRYFIYSERNSWIDKNKY